MVLNVGKIISLDSVWTGKFSDNLTVRYADSVALPVLGNEKWGFRAGLAFQFNF